MNLLKSSLSFILILLLTTSLKAQVDKPLSLEKDLHTYLEVIHEVKGFSGEILVAQDGEILFQEASGLMSVEHETEMQVGANYRIASITKTFTGALITIAHDEQKLNLNDKVVTYVPGLSDTFDDITIYQLLKHTSGVPHNEGIKNYWLEISKLPLNRQQAIEEFNKLDLLFEPGTRMHYSSLGYYLLALVLENVYDSSFQDILSKNILTPLKMTDTGVLRNQQIIPGMASGYHLVSDDSLLVAPYRNYSLLKGAGDMHSTSNDLLKWGNSFLDTKLIDEEVRKMIFTPDHGYGLGWYIDHSELEKYYHGGTTWGYSSFISIYPESGAVIILLSNVSTLPMESISIDVEKIVHGLPFEMPTPKKAISAESLDPDFYEGTFISDSGKMKLRISSQQNRLLAQLLGNPAFEIYPLGHHTFFGKKVEIEIRFIVEDNMIKGLEAERMGQTFNFKKL
jgi:CubicO group peptidase (beta-lactamase class C family)